MNILPRDSSPITAASPEMAAAESTPETTAASEVDTAASHVGTAATEVAPAPEMATTLCQCVSRDGRASERDRGNDNHDFGQ